VNRTDLFVSTVTIIHLSKKRLLTTDYALIETKRDIEHK